MSEAAFIGEIKLVAFSFPPQGWAFCNGQTLPINQNQALFSVLGTTYGGDGMSNFCLPNLQGRMPVHPGGGFTLGESAGEATHILTVNEMPAHIHPPLATARDATSPSPAGAVWAASSLAGYAASSDGAMSPAAIGTEGGGQPHENRAPYLVLNYVIALAGLYPTRN